MKIAITASECVPFAKTGGLGDVIGVLSKHVHKLNQNVIVILPKYKNIKTNKLVKVKESLTVFEGNRKTEFSVYKDFINNKVPVYFIENKAYFNRDGLYCDKKNVEYSDNGERFYFFCNAILKTLKAIKFKPDIIHLNDWQTGLISPILKKIYNNDLFFKNSKTVFTIHNIAYQGIYKKDLLENSVLKNEITGIEYFKNISFLKAGLYFSDCITTVSKTYAKEIQGRLGFGMQNILKKRKRDLYGILNGLDYKIWNPSQDKYIKNKYSLSKLKNKIICKKDLQNICKLPQIDVPVFGIVSRIDYQKGFDLLASVVPEIMKLDLQLIVLGVGDTKTSNTLNELALKYKDKLSVNLKFDENLAHKIYAGSDFFLMPSRFEPCGLSQLISFKYGTIPIVTNVGGLADTVTKNEGIIIKNFTEKAVLCSIKDALKLYEKKVLKEKNIKHIMKLNFSWDNQAKEYLNIYRKILKK